MRALKQADYFRKYVNDDKRQTCHGALLSILTLVLIVVFFYFEFSAYSKPILNRKPSLMQLEVDDPNEAISSNNIPVNINLILYHTPCESI